MGLLLISKISVADETTYLIGEFKSPIVTHGDATSIHMPNGDLFELPQQSSSVAKKGLSWAVKSTNADGVEFFTINTETFGTEEGEGETCRSMCFESPAEWVSKINKLPRGLIVIGGQQFMVDTSSSSGKAKVKGALTNNADNPLAKLNKQYVATQLSVLFAGGSVSPNVLSALSSSLNCYKLKVISCIMKKLLIYVTFFLFRISKI